MNPQEINEKEEKDIKKNIQVCSKSVNKNVFWSLVLCTLYGMADNLWSGTVFVAYLKLINGEARRGASKVRSDAFFLMNCKTLCLF